MAGKRWSELVSQELGNYDYLMGADVGLNFKVPLYFEDNSEYRWIIDIQMYRRICSRGLPGFLK